jgi:uncharacterized protein YhaN
MSDEDYIGKKNEAVARELKIVVADLHAMLTKVNNIVQQLPVPQLALSAEISVGTAVYEQIRKTRDAWRSMMHDSADHMEEVIKKHKEYNAAMKESKGVVDELVRVGASNRKDMVETIILIERIADCCERIRLAKNNGSLGVILQLAGGKNEI